MLLLMASTYGASWVVVRIARVEAEATVKEEDEQWV